MTTLEQMLEGAGLVAIPGHTRPNGNCLGSALGLHNYLRLDCPDVRVAVHLEETSDKFGYLKGFDEICHQTDGESYKLYVYPDHGDVGRLGKSSSLLAQVRKSLCLDHHVADTRLVGNSLAVPEASSTCKVLYGQPDEKKIDIRVAECLHMGIVHDTGVFKYSCTSGATMEIVGRPMAEGVDLGSIIDSSFYKETYIRSQTLGRALLESITFFDGKCIFSAIHQNETEFYGVDSKDTDGIIDQLRLANGVEVAIFLHRTGTQKYKMGMRSQSPVDVSQIAAFFGEGGHVRTAGYIVTGSIHNVISNLPEHIIKQLEPEAVDRI